MSDQDGKTASGVTFIDPPSPLGQRVTAIGPDAGLDMDKVKRAEMALTMLSGQFDGWMAEEVDKLDTAIAACRAGQNGDGDIATVFRAAHDLKGQGKTLGFPLAARAAASLTSLLETAPDPTRDVIWLLVEEHLKTIRAIVAENVRGEDHDVARTLVGELEAVTRKALAA